MTLRHIGPRPCRRRIPPPMKVNDGECEFLWGRILFVLVKTA